MNKRQLHIHPFNLGTLLSIDKSVFTLSRNQGVAIDAPCIS